MISLLLSKMGKGFDTNRLRLLLQTYREGWGAIRRHTSRERIAAVRDRRVQALFQYLPQITYYRNVLAQHDVSLDMSWGVDDLCRFPSLDRTVVNSRFAQFLPEQVPPSKLAYSSGSTGQPTVTLQSRQMRCVNSAVTMRAYHHNGLRLIGERFLRCVSGGYSLQGGSRNGGLSRRLGIYQGLHQTAQVLAHEVSDAADPILQQIARWRPTAIWGHPLAIQHVGEMLERAGMQIRPRLIITVDYPVEPFRADITALFKCKSVIELYGCFELGEIGFQCPFRNGFHLNDDYLIVEIMDGEHLVPDGRTGEVVVTGLMNKAFPLVRYRLGDMAAIRESDCPCGSKLRLLVDLQGRLADYIHLPDGRIVPPSVFIGAHGVLNNEIFRQYQVRQTARDQLVIEYIPSAAFSAGPMIRIDAALRQGLGPSVNVRFQQVQTILPDKSGKLHFIQALR